MLSNQSYINFVLNNLILLIFLPLINMNFNYSKFPFQTNSNMLIDKFSKVI